MPMQQEDSQQDSSEPGSRSTPSEPQQTHS